MVETAQSKGSSVPERKVPTVRSLSVTLHQDLFDEISSLVIPVAKAMALETAIADQHIKQKLPLLGEQEVATATNLKIEEFSISKMSLPLQNGVIGVVIRNVDVKVSTDVKALGVSLGKVVVTLSMDIDAIVKLKSTSAGVLSVSVEDVTGTPSKFDVKIGSGVGGDVLEGIADLFQAAIKGAISAAVAKPVDDALTQGLEGVLGKPLDVLGQVSSVGYQFLVGFVKDPVITAKDGVTLVLGVDTIIQDGLPKQA
ncbi:hypothetical protein HK096_006048 [Nowakowskiella sp. JEL0078]|nr:hypothetical protein HK096_006048 [Nowakowskiella sp. JEL0078]